MSYQQTIQFYLFLCMLTVACYKIGEATGEEKLGVHNIAYHKTTEAPPVNGWVQIHPKNEKHSSSSGEVVLQSGLGTTFYDTHPLERRDKAAVFPDNFTSPTAVFLDGQVPGQSTTSLNLSWTLGNVSEQRKHIDSDIDGGYQADHPGYRVGVVQGKVFLPSFDSTGPQGSASQWQAMKPVVQCDGNIMTLTASGHGHTHLLVDRGGAPPVPLLQLPSHCGYSVKTSWRDLVMKAPYDGCYITQQNGSYVLPMQWWGRPFQLSCPAAPHSHPSLPSRSSPSVFCSPYGMAVQIQGQEGQIPNLSAKVNGKWERFESQECAYRVGSQSGLLIFFSSFNAPCVAVRDGAYFLILLNSKEFALSCPVSHPQSSYFPSQQAHPHLSPSLQHYLVLPGGVSLSHPRPPQHKPSSLPPRPTPINPSGHRHQQPVYNVGPGQLSFSPESHVSYPSPPYQSPTKVLPKPHAIGKDIAPLQVSQRPTGPAQYAPGQHVMAMISYNPNQFQPPKQPLKYALHPTGPLYPQHGGLHRPTNPYHTTGVDTTSTYGQIPLYQHTSLPTNVVPLHIPHKAQQQSVPLNPFVAKVQPSQQPICPLDGHPNCDYRPYTLPHHQPPHLPPYHPSSVTTTPSSAVSITGLSQTSPSIHCFVGGVKVLLPSAEPESVQVKDQREWMLLSRASPECRYTLEKAQVSGVILISPLPTCHSYVLNLSTLSLPLRFWDGVQGLYQTLELQCPYQPPAGFPASGIHNTITPPVSTTYGQISPSPLPELRVVCFPHHMTVELPPGPISGIAVKDLKGNHMYLQDAPQHCGYSVSKGKDGQVILHLPFNSCHMAVKGGEHTIISVHVTISGRVAENRLSCPIDVPVSSHGVPYECNVPYELRLPCGPYSPSQAQCLSLGCCWDKTSDACYYPMDECTVDRHFVFSVPASLTEPPLSPALLVAAGDPTCTPQKVTHNHALFKIPLDGCGTRRLEIGKHVIYVVEIHNMIKSMSLNYGTITRDSTVRLFVECRYLPGSVVSVGYMVKSPSLGSSIHAEGVFGVQLRIAKDATYSSYYPQYHQPLQMLLGKPLFLEVRLLNPPDPKLVLLVHYCVAYPRSGHAAWVLLYNGCPNPLDPSPLQTVLPGPPPPYPQGLVRRFTVNTFRFLSKEKATDPDEEIYFMCSTEVCSPLDGPCVEGCFGQ